VGLQRPAAPQRDELCDHGFRRCKKHAVELAGVSIERPQNGQHDERSKAADEGMDDTGTLLHRACLPG
jgi:hypothetical protein